MRWQRRGIRGKKLDIQNTNQGASGNICDVGHAEDATDQTAFEITATTDFCQNCRLHFTNSQIRWHCDFDIDVDRFYSCRHGQLDMLRRHTCGQRIYQLASDSRSKV
jgi:hypothetical protein